MTDVATAPEGGESLSVREAALAINAPPEENNAAAPSEEVDAPERVSSPEDDAAPSERKPSGETEGEADPEETPPIEPPRSWTKEDREVFATLPRETQERLVALDRTREVELRRGQNEAAEQAKALQAKEQAAEQARQQYEQALPGILQQLSADYYRQFGIQGRDGKLYPPSDAQLQDWAVNDPEKYNLHDLALKRYQNYKQQSDSAAVRQQAEQERQAEEFRTSFEEWARNEAALFEKEAPEFVGEAGAKKRDEARKFALSRNIPEEMLQHPVFAHHGLQLVFRDAMLYREAQKAAAKPSPKPVPQVQRPGPASHKGEAKAAQLQDLNSKLSRSGNARDAAKLISMLG